MKRCIQKTSDGSTTIFIEEMDETYHSSHGAIQEAEHVFIQHGLSFVKGECIRILEMGFGTGLNALLTLKAMDRSEVAIEYHGVEAYPVEKELLEQLNYIELIGDEYGKLFEALHDAQWDVAVPIKEGFQLRKIKSRIEEAVLEKAYFDLIYYDAFGPRAQEEMWSIDVLKKMFDTLKPGGILVTYCAQGQFKRNIKELGFVVESLPGPPGKREMTRATKNH